MPESWDSRTGRPEAGVAPGWMVPSDSGYSSQGVRVLLGKRPRTWPLRTTGLCPPAVPLHSWCLSLAGLAVPLTSHHGTLTTFGGRNTWYLKTEVEKEPCFIQACF